MKINKGDSVWMYAGAPIHKMKVFHVRGTDVNNYYNGRICVYINPSQTKWHWTSQSYVLDIYEPLKPCKHIDGIKGW
jgi:hypothetical protein